MGLRRRSSIYAENLSYSQVSGECSTSPLVPPIPAPLPLLPYQVLAELYPVLGRHAEQIGDDEHGEGLGEGAHELALATGNEGVDLLVGQLPHVLLVLLEAHRRDQAHQQRPVVGVHRRIHGRELIVEWRLVAVFFDQRRKCPRFRVPSGEWGSPRTVHVVDMQEEKRSGSL